jgi:hypothetical protein
MLSPIFNRITSHCSQNELGSVTRAILCPIKYWCLFNTILVLGYAQDLLTIQLQFDASLRTEISWTPHSEASLYTLESTDLLSNVWKPVPPAGQWPSEETTFLDPRASFLPSQRFYRVIAAPLPKPNRARLISFEKVDTLTHQDVEEWFDRIGISAIETQSGVNLFYVLYETVDAFGKSTVASGAVVTPTDLNEALPLFSYQHSTILDRELVPSRFSFSRLESLLPIFIASQGFVTAAPDMIGLGDSPGFHPFLIAETAVNAVTDLLPIAQEIARFEKIDTIEEVYLMGYGEGGHSTMAVHRELESMEEPKYKVIASVPMAGPHDLSELFLEHLLQEEQAYPQPYLLPYLIVSFNDVYSFYDDPIEVFTSEVASRAIPRINGRSTGESINDLLPSQIPRDFLQPGFLDQLQNDPEHPFRIALRQNDVYDWKPSASLRMYHCDADETIPKTLSEKALDTFFDNGSSSAELIDPIPVLNHAECDAISFTSAMTWIENERN